MGGDGSNSGGPGGGDDHFAGTVSIQFQLREKYSALLRAQQDAKQSRARLRQAVPESKLLLNDCRGLCTCNTSTTSRDDN